MFTFGPGVVPAGRLTRDLDPLRRVIVVLGVGSAATPVLIDVLGRLNLIPIFPYVAFAMAGGGAGDWRGPRRQRDRNGAKAADARRLRGCSCSGGGVLGAVVFWHRLQDHAGGIVLYGDYDSADLGYYAAVASEASHTVPPTASYYSGHKLNAAYYPHLVLGMIHRFAGVPVMSMYYRYAWPTFLALGALTAFALVRSLASRGVAAARRRPDPRRQRFLVSRRVVPAARRGPMGLPALADELPLADDAGAALQHVGVRRCRCSSPRCTRSSGASRRARWGWIVLASAFSSASCSSSSRSRTSC